MSRRDRSIAYSSGIDPPSWPKWLGGACLAVGILGAAYYGYQTATANSTIVSQVVERSSFGSSATLLVGTWGKKMALVNASLSACSILLSIGGVLVLLHRRICAPLLRTWAFLKIAVASWFLYTKGGFDQALQYLVFNGPNAMAGDGASLASSSARVETILVLSAHALWLMALPAFVLFWFSLTKVRTPVRDWR